MRRVLFVVFLIGLFLSSLHAQNTPPSDTVGLKKLISYSDQLDFQASLTEYVSELYADYGFQQIPRKDILSA